MKNYILLLIIVLFAACTKEDEENLGGPSISKNDLKFSVTQEAGHDNIVMLNSVTEGGYIPYWQYTGGFSKKVKDTINLPFAGSYWIRYTIYTKGGPIGDSTPISVSENDPEYFSSPMWNLLTNAQEGKTWVWATDVPTLYCYGNGPGDALTPQWWQNGASYLVSQGVDGDEMTFDLDGAKNYTLTHNGTSTKAIFELDTLNATLKISGSDIPLGVKTTYNIVKLNENELTIVQQGDGWRNIWLFKRKGYTY